MKRVLGKPLVLQHFLKPWFCPSAMSACNAGFSGHLQISCPLGLVGKETKALPGRASSARTLLGAEGDRSAPLCCKGCVCVWGGATQGGAALSASDPSGEGQMEPPAPSPPSRHLPRPGNATLRGTRPRRGQPCNTEGSSRSALPRPRPLCPQQLRPSSACQGP